MIVTFRKLACLMVLLGLAACGDDAGSPDTAANTAQGNGSADETPADVFVPRVIPETERAEGVIYQDDIYANWPYQ